MSQSLIINGKEYVQSSVLTSLYKYTPDYIGKLAREEKIIGTQVGRQWYIEPESLKVFLHKASVEKEIRAEELSLKRKVEHQAFQQKQNISASTESPPHIALAQVLAIIGCGTIAGLLGFNIVSSDITLRDISQSFKESTSLIAQTFSPVDALQKLNDEPNSKLFSFEHEMSASVGQKEDPTDVFVSAPPSEDVDATIKQQFSDEVLITKDTEGSVFVQPIFSQEADTAQLFKVVPVGPTDL